MPKYLILDKDNTYRLPDTTDVGALQGSVTDAMRDSHILQVRVVVGDGEATLVLNGRNLETALVADVPDQSVVLDIFLV
jgi:hypothetical protein